LNVGTSSGENVVAQAGRRQREGEVEERFKANGKNIVNQPAAS
jgi:hypothetical protein